MNRVLVTFLFVFLGSTASAYDCSHHVPFEPVEYQEAFIQVARFSWVETDQGRQEIVEEVCSSKEPLLVPVQDIRGREEEWYDCNQRGVMRTCLSRYGTEEATIVVTPSIVIRKMGQRALRDTHFHARVYPQNDPTRLFDLFGRNGSYDLSKKPLLIDSAGGGRGENSGVDSYYVRIDFLN